MKISYNWLKKYLNFDLSPERCSEILTDIGLEVEGLEYVEAVKGGLEGLVIGEVLSKEKHPDADRLACTTVNIGEGEPLEIVCGAPNVDKGQKVVVATVGTMLYPLEGEPFKIKKGKIRGKSSLGMICAEDEIGLGKGHDGIIVLPADAKVGQSAASYYQLESDPVFEIGLTPNRADAMSHYGVARDLKVALQNMHQLPETQNPKLVMPDVSSFAEDTSIVVPKIKVTNPEACPKYLGLVVKNIEVKASPDWLKRALQSIGLAPINNVVDITNYVQHELGQPLHAFDLAKISEEVVVQNLKSGTIFTTLDDTKRELDSNDLMICNGNEPMCIAGVFGGKESGVSNETTAIFLESAYFNPVSVRKTAKRHGLNTDASYRYERGIDPNITQTAIERAALLIQEICGGSYSAVSAVGQESFPPFEIQFHPQKARDLIGLHIEDEQMLNILQDLDIQCQLKGDIWLLSVPPYRTDVQREADVVEDILRIYGYNQVAAPDKVNMSLSYAPKPDAEKVKNKIADLLAGRGFFEMMSNSLTKEKYATLDQSEDQAVKILNPLSGDLGIMRTTMLFDGLEAVSRNQKFKSPDLRLFEFGNIYKKTTDSYEENMQLALFLAGKKVSDHWRTNDSSFSAFDLKEEVMGALGSLGLIGKLQSKDIEHHLFAQSQQINAHKTELVVWGKMSAEICSQLDVKGDVYAAIFNWDGILEKLNMNRVKFKPLPKFPTVRRDLSLLLKKEVGFDAIEKVAFSQEKKLLQKVDLFDVYEGKNLDEGTKSYAVSFFLRDEEKTLNDKLIEKAMTRIREGLEKELGATLR